MRASVLAVVLLVLATCAFAQGFAGLGQSSEDFAQPAPAPAFSFPRDHGQHPDYRIEWWYLTATLKDADGNDYGVQWTLFRSALSPEGPQVWMGHAGLTTQDEHYTAEAFARDGIGQAGVNARPFEAWINDWSMVSKTANDGASDAYDAISLSASFQSARFDLDLVATGPLVFHGQDGYSVKSDSGQASYYYSQPFYQVSGVLDLPSGPVSVTGEGWLDREWSSQPLDADQDGWDWFSLHFDDGHRLMAFGLRGLNSSYFYASWVTPAGDLTPTNDLRLTPLATTQVAGRKVPTSWQIELPGFDLDIEVAALNPKAWQSTLFPYWEGPVVAQGSHTGKGYLEMTGYE